VPHSLTSTLATLLLLILPALAALPARAEQPSNPQAVVGKPAAALAPEDARRTLDILRDDKRRAELIATLETIAAAGRTTAPTATAPTTTAIEPTAPPAAVPAQPAEAPAAKPAEPALRLAPDSLGARMLLGASATVRDMAVQARDTFFAVGNLPWLVDWLYSALTDPLMYGWLLGVAWRLALVLAVGIGLARGISRVLQGPRAALETRIATIATAAQHEAAGAALARAEDGDVEALTAPEPEAAPGQVSLWRRIPLALGLFGMDLLPILAFLVGSHAVLATPLGGSQLSQLVIGFLVQAVALWRASLAVVGALAAPGHAPARLLPIADDTAAWLLRWTSRIAGIAYFAEATLQSALLLGLPRPAHAGWLKLTSLACVACVVVMVAQRRRAVADWLRGGGDNVVLFGDARRVLAPVWHWLAIGYVLTMWVVWAADYGVGEVHVLTAMVSTLVVLLAMRLVAAGIVRTLERRLAVPAGLEARYPGLEDRALSYRPLLRAVVGAAVLLAGLLVLGEIWGLAPLYWLVTSRTGRDVLASLGTIGTTLLAAFAVWEAVTLGLNRHVERLKAKGDAARSARLRTLQPMLRTALMVAIVIVVGLTVLSQIGVNIAPLLAGAGVLGLAIGIGSQKLVQDLITGLFLLLENAMQVGDVVTLGGTTGVVEELTVRSIRLRSEDGSVQIIPFSAVTSVTNMTRDFSQAVIETQVSFEEDYETVVTALTEIAAALRAEQLWANDIQGDLDVMGMVKLDAGAMVVKSRIKCGPFARWKVQRELYRRIKEGFAARGIAMPSTRQTLVLENPAAGGALQDRALQDRG